MIVLASHYETNYPLKEIDFVGANDGACTSALLIGIGEYLRSHPPEGYSVWLVFDDGEEAIKEWSDSDSLYGTRHLAAKWSKDGTLPEDQGVFARGHDRRQRPQHRPRQQLDPMAARYAEGGGEGDRP